MRRNYTGVQPEYSRIPVLYSKIKGRLRPLLTQGPLPVLLNYQAALLLALIHPSA
jgi:hypothetical protein